MKLKPGAKVCEVSPISEPGNDTAASPASLILQISSGLLLSRALAVVAELGVADLISDEPKRAEELSSETSSDPNSLYRVLRLLASKGIFSEDEKGAFHLTPSATLLRSDVPGSLRDMVRSSFQNIFWDAYRELPYAVQTGETAFGKAFGAEFFDYLALNTEANNRFDEAMARGYTAGAGALPQNDRAAVWRASLHISPRRATKWILSF